jgi:glycosyltransferase involved in cell wall biosynthesis
LPRRCGIATFTTDLEQAVRSTAGIGDTAIIAMSDQDNDYDYPPVVRATIHDADPAQYLEAASFINRGGFDIACLQHEFGIFGGEAGNHIIKLIDALTIPLVTTLHTILDAPNAAQRAVMESILAKSARVVVMSEKGREILLSSYLADPAIIVVIPHGIPDNPLLDADSCKEKLGFAERQVILTFGLISPSKGIETMIDAMEQVIARCPEAMYVVMGATHPNLVRDAGEAYRHGLEERVARLGLSDKVIFLDQFIDRPALLEHIAMCDVYVTPYLGKAQMTSGTLAYSHGLGRPVVSTPYWHAKELLADGTGILVPFADPVQLGEAVSSLLCDSGRRLRMGRAAYEASRPTTWINTGARYADCFRSAFRSCPGRIVRLQAPALRPRSAAVLHGLEPSTKHLAAMCDDTGLFQHAVHDVPDRNHGYCIDDNARALLLSCTLAQGQGPYLPDALALRFAAFIQHGWNPDNRRFRNFMGYDRRWCEPEGSEDSHGRTLWALGACARHGPNAVRTNWARGLFSAALGVVENFTSPRAWAFTLLGLSDYCQAHPLDSSAAQLQATLAFRLADCLASTETPDWVWFEHGLAYDNARLPEALIRTGAATEDDYLVDSGLRSLRWLMRVQTAPAGHFRPVGSHSFGTYRCLPAAFDQQPLEATATIAACMAANAVDPAGGWEAEATRAFEWFLGSNDLALPLVDLDTGACRDGLHPDRANENRGAESVLSWLLAAATMRMLAGASFGSGENSALEQIKLSSALNA